MQDEYKLRGSQVEYREADRKIEEEKQINRKEGKKLERKEERQTEKRM